MVAVIRQYRDVEHVFYSPAPEHQEVIGSLKAQPLRQVLRYHVWETSRSILYGWGGLQLALAPLLMWLLLLSMRVSKLLVAAVAAMLLIACFNQFVVGPEMTYAGRALDFGGPVRPRYLMLNALYLGLEALKAAMGLTVAWRLFTYHSGREASTDRKPGVIREQRAASSPGG